MDVYSKYLKYKKKFLALKAGAAPAQAPIPEIVVVAEEPPSPYRNLNQYLGDRRSAYIIAVVSLLQNEELYFFVCTARVPGYLESEEFVFPVNFQILIPIRKKYFNPEEINLDINLLKRKFKDPKLLSQTTAFVLFNQTAYAHQHGAYVTYTEDYGEYRISDICVKIIGSTELPTSGLPTLLEYIDSVKKLEHIEKGKDVQDIQKLVTDFGQREPITARQEEQRPLPTIEFPAETAVPPTQRLDTPWTELNDTSKRDLAQGLLGLNEDNISELERFSGTRKP